MEIIILVDIIIIRAIKILISIFRIRHHIINKMINNNKIIFRKVFVVDINLLEEEAEINLLSNNNSQTEEEVSTIEVATTALVHQIQEVTIRTETKTLAWSSMIAVVPCNLVASILITITINQVKILSAKIIRSL